MLIDGGDLLSPVKKYPNSYAELYLQSFNLMGYDAMNIGEGELRFGLPLVRHLDQLADFPLLGANTHATDPSWQPFMVKAIAGVRVAVIGIIAHRFPIRYAALSLAPESPVAKELIERLRGQADMIVVAAHMNDNQARDLIQSVAGIDLLLLGHIKKDIPGEMINDTLLVSPGKKGENVNVVDVDYDLQKRAIRRLTSELYPLGNDIEKDPEIIALLGPFNEKFEAMRNAEYRQDQTKQGEIRQLVDDSLKMTPEEFFNTYDPQLIPQPKEQP